MLLSLLHLLAFRHESRVCHKPLRLWLLLEQLFFIKVCVSERDVKDMIFFLFWNLWTIWSDHNTLKTIFSYCCLSIAHWTVSSLRAEVMSYSSLCPCCLKFNRSSRGSVTVLTGWEKTCLDRTCSCDSSNPAALLVVERGMSKRGMDGQDEDRLLVEKRVGLYCG